ncbi:M20 aminoacylase family protein [Oryzibacter oryziterrae]|uniref:M20 aminoacylase family protein n=1 Tax=Oryzibacter oryziterrae TaxID=2766474 RepID=UPI001F3FAB63|nr:M20 aminoacylase family protein [Oryzibacter oryziterrae]
MTSLRSVLSSRPDAAQNGATGVEPAIAADIARFVAIRRDFHRHPELAFKERRTAARIAELLGEWGYEVTQGLAETGVVGTLRRGNGFRALALRADIDALPIREATDKPYASEREGVMHACGHDGHTTILLAAAYHLARSDKINGTLHLIFQPAEEIGAGANRLISEGLFNRFPADAIFGLHNWPGVPTGHFGFIDGPAMASVDQAIVRITGKGGHGAAPHETVDPVVAAAHAITALQSIVSRNVDPLDTGVVTVGAIHGGSASNVIPEWVDLKITTRSFRPEVRRLLAQRVPAVIRAQAESLGASADVDYKLGFPSVINAQNETNFLRQVALDTFGEEQVLADFRPRTASEDFSFFLDVLPGSFFFVGNGDGAPLHSPAYDFNDAILAPAATFWVRIAERFLS